MTAYGYFGTMAETALKYTQNCIQNVLRAAGLKTDDKTNPPRGGDSDRFFRMKIVTVGWMVGRL